MLNVSIEDRGEVVILHCRGRVVHGSETQILCAAVQHFGREIVLDLRRVETVDAAGIGMLVSLQAAGIYLKLANPAKPVREVLRTAGLDSMFEVREDCPPEGTWPGAEPAEAPAPKDAALV